MRLLKHPPLIALFLACATFSAWVRAEEEASPPAEIRLNLDNDSERTCQFSHSTEGEGWAYHCAGTDYLIVSLYPQSLGGQKTRQLVAVSSKGPLRVHETPSSMLNWRLVSDSVPPESPRKVPFQRFSRLNQMDQTLNAPVITHFNRDRSQSSIFAFKAAPGQTPSPGFSHAFRTLDREVRVEIETLSKKYFDSNEVQVDTEDGRQLTCVRGVTNQNALDEYRALPIVGDAPSPRCEMFSCDPISTPKGEFHPVLQLTLDHRKAPMTGTGTPELLTANHVGFGPALGIRRIMVSGAEAYLAQETGNHPWDNLESQLPAATLEGLKRVGSSQQAAKYFFPHYRAAKISSNFFCDSPVINRTVEAALRNSQVAAEKLQDLQFVLLVESVNGALQEKYLLRDQLPSESCHLEGDVFLARSAAETALARHHQLNLTPISSAETESLFREVKAMGDIPHDYIDSGCESRAHVIANRLKDRGVPAQKVWAYGGNLAPQERMDSSWSFHVATVIPVLNSQQQTEWKVIDPSLADGPVSIDQWRSRFDRLSPKKATQLSWPFAGGETLAPAQFSRVLITPPEVYLPEESLPTPERLDKTLKLAREANESNLRSLQFRLSGPSPFLPPR